MLKKQLLFVLAMVATTFAISGTGYAAENKDDYTVNIEVPDTQAPRSKLNGYFDLVLAPNQTENLKIDVTNISNKQIVVDMDKGTAGTNDNGSVVYTTKWADNRFAGLTNKLADYITLDQDKVTLQPGQEVTVGAKVTMPATPVTGVLAGGISFYKENQQNTANPNAKGMKLNNTVKYDIAVLAQNNTDAVTPDVDISNVAAKTVSAQTAFSVDMVNSSPAFANTAEIIGDVTAPNGEHFKRTQSMMQFAPNSRFAWQIWTDGKKVPSGDYDVNVEAFWGKDKSGKYVDKSGTAFLYHTAYRKTVHVTGSQATDLAKKDSVAQMQSAMPVAYKVFIGIAVLVAALIAFFILGKKHSVTVEYIGKNDQIISRKNFMVSRLKRAKVALANTDIIENVNSKMKVKDNTLILDGRTTLIYIKTRSDVQ
ncbi:DUF916 domain-containing protein [Weissella confusa]|uniref:DUF916 domain-containing protein n=1 Tax=Weissella confusa TaxID=1583 RepID=UPI0021BF8D3D|nr:DUF916 domain-containing protein [Weissella confusa]MCT8393393.1 DUF916 domain-containing protein [Weissella confusa]